MWEVRTITEDDADLYRARTARAFGHDGEDSDDSRQRFREIFEYDRTLAAIDNGDIVGTGAAFTLDVTVPGGSRVPMGGTTVITVQPTHRRQGVLRALMDAHLADVSEREEPLAGLWASEAPIYGRFGYGPATYRYSASIDGSRVSPSVSDESGTLHLVDVEEAKKVVPGLYEASRSRSGMLSRSDAWWTHRIFADPESWRGGKTARRWLVHETNGEADGYACYRQKSDWDDFVAKGEVDVIEVIATDPAAHLSLWRFLTNVDLFPKVEFWNLPVDDAVVPATADFRRIRRTYADGLWIKLMDVPKALQLRQYESDGRVDFAVGETSYEVVVENGEARCGRIDREASLQVDPDVLGHLYLGGGDAHAMAAAGRITGDPDSVSDLHRLFRTDVAPWCNEVF